MSLGALRSAIPTRQDTPCPPLNATDKGFPFHAYTHANDGPVASPESHTILFQTSAIRVLHVHMAPRFREPYHTHHRPCLMFDTQQTALDYYGPDGTILFHGPPYNASSPLFADSLVPEWLHSVASTSTLTYHAIRIEFKPRGRPTYAGWPALD